MTIKELRDKLAKDLQAATDYWKGVDTACRKEDREPTDEERAAFDKMRDECEDLRQKIDRIEADLQRGVWVSHADRAEIISKTGHLTMTPGPVRNELSDPVSKPQRVKIPATARRERTKYFSANDDLGMDADASAYGFANWFLATQRKNLKAAQWLHDHMGMDVAATLSSSTNTAGGALIPDIWANDIIRLVQVYGVARRYCRVWPMTSDTLIVPIRTGGQTAYFTGQGENPTESDPTFNLATLVAKDLVAMTVAPEQLLEDASINLADFIAQEGALAIAYKEDDCLWNGTGTSTYGGIKGVAGVQGAGSQVTADSGHTAIETIDAGDYGKAVGAFPEYAAADPKWFIHRACWGSGMYAVAVAGGGTTVLQIQSAAPEREFFGYPVVISQRLNSTLGADVSVIKAYFGDLRLCAIFGDRRQIRFASDQGGKYFQAGTVAFKTTSRFDIIVHSIDSASVAGPLIGLKTAAS